MQKSRLTQPTSVALSGVILWSGRWWKKQGYWIARSSPRIPYFPWRATLAAWMWRSARMCHGQTSLNLLQRFSGQSCLVDLGISWLIFMLLVSWWCLFHDDFLTREIRDFKVCKVERQAMVRGCARPVCIHHAEDGRRHPHSQAMDHFDQGDWWMRTEASRFSMSMWVDEKPLAQAFQT